MNCVFPEEHIVHLEIAGIRTAELICTNEDLNQLVIGYLWNQGVIRKLDDLKELNISPDGASAFAVVSREEGSAPETDLKWMPVQRTYDIATLQKCADIMNTHAEKYRETGGVHCSALFVDGTLLSVFEDLGRHNTMDKIAGDLLSRNITVSDALLVTTGRISSDMVQKANRMGAAVIASYSTPTSLAKELAEQANMTLISYFRREKRAVCTVSDRILP